MTAAMFRRIRSWNVRNSEISGFYIGEYEDESRLLFMFVQDNFLNILFISVYC
jgi:hypothetical protein